MQMWIIGPDSYRTVLFKPVFSKISHIVGIGSESIVGIVM